MIEIYLLEQLLAVHKYGTLSSAAEHLHLAQPSVSRSMQKLESILGVTLFDRQKNRILLNETGKLAAEYAKRILEEEQDMILRIRAFDRSLHTLNIGSCAPGPLMDLLPKTAGVYSDLTISSAVDSEEKLLKGLHNSEYGIIILPHPVESEGLICQKYRSEQLFLSVSAFHPAASYKKITFAEMDGQNFIMYAYVGFWKDIVHAKMPHSKFFLQNDIETVGELARYSDLPSFSTDITMEALKSRRDERINIPFSDAEAKATYYFVYKKKNKAKLNIFFQSI